jgi:hypothetical protein
MESFLIPLIPMLGILFPVLIVWIVHHYENKEKEQFHDSLQKLIETGQELSPELLASVPGYKGKQKGDKDDVRSGCIATGSGVGIALLGKFGVDVDVVFGAGLLTICIGLGLLSYGIYKNIKQSDKNIKQGDGLY